MPNPAADPTHPGHMLFKVTTLSVLLGYPQNKQEKFLSDILTAKVLRHTAGTIEVFSTITTFLPLKILFNKEDGLHPGTCTFAKCLSIFSQLHFLTADKGS